jgi:Pyruvate/2-oxoacid:ferredoxin oxidoreductase delta subunit
MCKFCVRHGDGRTWYLEASTYAYDLDADLKRRNYLVDFVRDFPTHEDAVRGLERVDRLPSRVRHLASAAFSRKMQDVHFGQPVPIEECEAILDICTSVVRVPCVCRTSAKTRDEGYCLAITTKPIDAALEEAFADYDMGPDLAKFERLTKEQTLVLLRRCEEQGLMHSVWTFLTPFVAGLCNCDLASGCMAMMSTVEHDMPTMFKGHSIARADVDACTGCRACIERCPFTALSLEPGSKRAVVDAERCYGCGVCRSACRYEALALVSRQTEAALSAG